MKAAIITLHRVYNYGSVLQAYATQRQFEKAGFDVEVIDYITEQRTIKKHLSGKAPSNSPIQGSCYKVLKSVSIILKEMTFGRFIKEHLLLTHKYITADDLEKDPPLADLYVTGSDQTWNSKYNKGIDRGFFLTFVPEGKKKISFVASFGKSELDPDEIEETRRYLSGYSALSVREDSAVEILRGLGRTDAIQLIDPTLQLTKDEWMTLASKRLVKERYLILMLLYNEDNHATEYARKIADQKGLKMVKISWDLKKPALVDQLFTHRSPADFLSLFAFADFVVTNSFHGTAFSINLERQFVVVPRSEFNTRITSLLSLCGLEDRLVSSEEAALLESEKEIRYSEVKEVLKAERERADVFIQNLKR